MARGVPKAGFRAPRRSAADKLSAVKVSYAQDRNETDTEIEARLAERFEILDIMTEACMCGNARSLVISGPAGVGKSFGVERILADWDPNAINHTIVKGYVRATGLVKLMYQYREAGQVIVFDDADSIFYDDVSLNLLKAVCDTTEKRKVSWLTEGSLIDEETAERIPRSFDFNGTIIFLTNLDFDLLIARGHKLAPHLEALVSRSHYLDLSMKTKRDYLVRIKQVINQGLLDNLIPTQRSEVVDFIDTNADRLRELSLRMAIKIGSLRLSNGDNWAKIARVTCLRNK